MEIGVALLKRNGHFVRHVYDAAAKRWVADEAIPARAPKPFRPMLAETYKGGVAFPVFAQPKIDGVRCIARADGLFSRDGLRFESCAHVEAALAPLFAADPALVLDGELWAEGFTLGAIAGMARRAAPARVLSFRAFDLVSADPFADRLARLGALIGPVEGEAVALVPTTLIETEAALDRHYRDALVAGFEGQMIRFHMAPYGRGRVSDILKRKPEEDEEAVIVGFAVGEGAEGKVALTLRRADGAIFVAPAPLKGRDRQRIVRIGAALAGLEATYRFSGRLPSGAPRDPVVKLIHDLPRL